MLRAGPMDRNESPTDSRSFLLSGSACITETLPHLYDKFMTCLPRQDYPANDESMI